MAPALIWDLPTRLFHWLLAAGFAAAAFIALVLGEHSALFPYHAILGLTLVLMVALRVVWGVVGTRYARFGSFAFGPGAVVAYAKSTMFGGGTRHVGHNPGSAWAIFAMLALVLALGVTGVLMGMGVKGWKDAHELCAYALVGVVVVHVLGVALHTLRHRENITASMIHGRKNAEPASAIASARPLAAIVFLVVTGAWVVGLLRNYDPGTQRTTVPLWGASLQLGEGESKERDGVRGRDRDHDDDD
jgi:cytochrome b